MARDRMWVLALAVLWAVPAPSAWGGGPPVRKQEDPAQRLAARIDELIADALTRARVKPAALADDATFLRRLSLDVAGKIPHVADARQFLADKATAKRARAIERLLDSPAYANRMTDLWRDLLLPEANADFQRRYLVPSMERWLHRQFAENVPYDKMVRELIALPMGNRNDQMNFYRIFNNDGPLSPMAFYLTKQGKPEELAASTARLFLGVRLECAQCHDHPFATWKREQFWGLAAFFGGIRGGNPNNFFNPLTEVSDRRELGIPNTERVAQATFLDGKAPRWKFKVSARTTLAEWLTAPNNPFFARTAANRVWAQMFGIGLVDPADDFREDNPASHPELLDLLARELVAQKFDLKFLIRAIALSKTYQLDSAYPGPKPPPLRLFARMPIKGLTPDQLFESLGRATGLRDNTPRAQRFFVFGTPRQQFMDKFEASERPTEHHTSIPQALTLMNNKMIADATHPDRGQVLGAIASAPFMNTRGRIEAVYLAVLSRKPKAEEAERFVRYVELGGVSLNKKKALADVYWALLNSTEFILNH
jgi:hypothetical protein